MPHLFYVKNGVTKSILLYSNKSSIQGSDNAVAVRYNGTTYYAQTAKDTDPSLISTLNSVGCGQGDLAIYYNGSKRHFYVGAASRSYSTLYTLTSGTTVSIPKSTITKYGGVLFLYGGIGSSSYGSGGKGQIIRVEIPCGITSDVSISCSFARTAGTGGTGGTASHSTYGSNYYTTQYSKKYTCPSSTVYGYGSGGGSGGYNCSVSYTVNGTTKSAIAYGGGGGGGNRGSVGYYASCSSSSGPYNYSTAYGSFGTGGSSGNGVGSSSVNGASAIVGGEYGSSSVSARLIVGVYNE